MERNALDRRGQRAVEDLVLAARLEIEAGKWTQDAFAEHATKKMGRPITKANVGNAAKAVEVKFRGQVAAGALKSASRTAAGVRVLARELVRLAGELGYVVSPEVHALAGEEQQT